MPEVARRPIVPAPKRERYALVSAPKCSAVEWMPTTSSSSLSCQTGRQPCPTVTDCIAVVWLPTTLLSSLFCLSVRQSLFDCQSCTFTSYSIGQPPPLLCPVSQSDRQTDRHAGRHAKGLQLDRRFDSAEPVTHFSIKSCVRL